jgi:hypothetical protein
MLIHTEKSPNETSYHGTAIRTTVGRLKALFPYSYEEENDGRDKCNYYFTLEDGDGDIVTIYDWKEYRPIGDDELIDFHIGGKSGFITEKAKDSLTKLLNGLTF